MDESTIGLKFDQEGEAEVESAIKRFAAAVAGSSEKLQKMQQDMYSSTKDSVLFSQTLASHPIKSLQEFAASEEKVAVAGEYMRGQLEFIAASRFGSIMIWSTILSGIADGMKKVAENSIEMETAVHKVASAFLDVSQSAELYRSIQDRISLGAIKFGQDYKEISEILWELKSSGLSTADTFAAMDSAQKLVVAGAGNVNQSTRILSALYKEFGGNIKNASTAQEKFAEIAGTLTYVMNQSLGKIDDIAQSFKYAGAATKAAGLDFQQTAAIIAVANNAMLFGSTAGTGLSQAIIAVSKNWKKLNEDFKLGLDPTKPLNMIELINRLAQNQGLLNKEVGAFGELSQDVGARALRVLVANSQGVEELNRLYHVLTTEGMAKFQDEVANIQMDTFTAQLKRAGKAMSEITMTELWRDYGKRILSTFSDAVEGAKKFETELSATDRAAKNLVVSLFSEGSMFRLDVLAMRFKDLYTAMQKGDDIPLLDPKKLEDANRGAQSVAKTFDDILSDEDREKFMLLQTNQTLEEKILKTAHALDLAKEEAIAQYNINAGSKEAVAAKEKVLKLQEEMNHQVDQQIEKNGKEQAFLIDIEEKMNKIKKIPLHEEIDGMNKALQDSLALLNAAAGDDEKMKKALSEVVTATVAVENAYAKVDQQINKVLSAQEKMASEAEKYAKMLIEHGQGRAADDLMQKQLEMAKNSEKIAKTDDEQEKALKSQLSILQSMSELKIVPYGGDSVAQSLDIMKRLTDLEEKSFENARDELDKSNEALSKSSSEVETVKNVLSTYPTTIEQASAAIEKGMNKNLEGTKSILFEVSGSLEKIRKQILDMPHLNFGSDKGDAFATQLKNETNRQSN
jgi:TP901 family phage tail tape measure protein